MVFAVKIVLSLLLLGYLGWSLDLTDIVQTLKGADWSLVAAAAACLIAGQLLSAIRWSWLARGLGLSVMMGRKIELYFLGMFLSLFLPSIIGGDVARGWLLAKGRKDAGWSAAASVVLERLNGLLGLLLLVSFCLFFLDLPWQWLLIWSTSVGVVLLLVVTTPRWWRWLLASAWQGRFSGWRHVALTTADFYRAWWKSLPLSLLFQAMVVQSHLLLGMAVGMDLSWFAYGVIVCLTAIATAVPISFNGFGIREAGYVGMATWFGADPSSAAAMAALWVVVLLIAACPGGVILWRMGGSKVLRKESADGG